MVLRTHGITPLGGITGEVAGDTPRCHTATQPRQAERSELESAHSEAREALRASEVWHTGE